MGEIPEDVRREAELTADNVAVSSQHPALNPALDGFFDSVLHETIVLNSANAILAERERCAKVAEGAARAFAYVDSQPIRQGAALQVASAIRSGAAHD